MNYRQAVTAALQNNPDAFEALYEATYRNMYYIALKYVKNTEDAEDVLQDSYIKAFQNLSSLRDPDNFPGWLGRIVANTSKNLLVRKKPVLFSEIESENEDGDAWLYEFADDRIDYQPELNYTMRETTELVRSLIDCLSDEQRMCIIMFYLDHQSIRDIAATFSISENTVKSRLNYGRKALRKKAEELQKKGYTFYGLGVLPLLLFLLRTERASAAFAQSADIAMKAGRTVLRANPKPSSGASGVSRTAQPSTDASGASQSAQQPAGASGASRTAQPSTDASGASQFARQPADALGASRPSQQPDFRKHRSNSARASAAVKNTAVKSGLKFTARKIIIGITATAVIGGGTGAYLYYSDSRPVLHHTSETPHNIQILTETDFPAATELLTEANSPATTELLTEADSPAATEPLSEADSPAATEPKELTEDQYPSLICGNLTKQELEFVLAYGPQEIPETGFDQQTVQKLLIQLYSGSRYQELLSGTGYLHDYGLNDQWQSRVSVSDVNRLFSSFSNFTFTEETYSAADESPVRVDGDVLVFSPATMSWSPSATITSATYTEEELSVYYTYEALYDEWYDPDTGSYQYNVTETTRRKATFCPNEQGMYRIIKIEENF